MTKQKPRFGYKAGSPRRAGRQLSKSRRRPTLPHGYPCSTIGSEELNFRVRDGIGCGLFEITTGNLWRATDSRSSNVLSARSRVRIRAFAAESCVVTVLRRCDVASITRTPTRETLDVCLRIWSSLTTY